MCYRCAPQLLADGVKSSELDQFLIRDAERIELTRRCTRAVFDRMRDRQGETFFDFEDVVDGHPEDVFIDNFGHLTEAGNDRVAEGIAELLIPLVRP